MENGVIYIDCHVSAVDAESRNDGGGGLAPTLQLDSRLHGNDKVEKVIWIPCQARYGEIGK